MLISGGTLKVSELHFVMQAISLYQYYWHKPAYKRYHFGSRAKALLARWEPILLQDIHYYQWLNTRALYSTMTYVPKQAGVSFLTVISSTFQIVQI